MENETIKGYKDLLVWQNGISLVKLVYELCNDIPKEELFSLQSQLKRSVVSIPSNIAEGYGRNTKSSYIQFLRVARGSLYELETQLIIAFELEFISEEKYNKIILKIEKEGKMLNGLIKAINLKELKN